MGHFLILNKKSTHNIYMKINSAAAFSIRDPGCYVLEQPLNQEFNPKVEPHIGEPGQTEPKEQDCHVAQPQGLQYPSILFSL